MENESKGFVGRGGVSVMDFDDYPSQSHQSGFPSIMTLSLTALSDLPGDEGGEEWPEGRGTEGQAPPEQPPLPKPRQLGPRMWGGGGGHRLPAPDGGAFPNDAYINS